MQDDHYLSMTPCGRCACIELYTGENCLFCSAAEQSLREVGIQLLIPEESICVIEIDTTKPEDIKHATLSIPMIRVCDMTLTGIPDEGSLTDALVRIMLKPCFKWGRRALEKKMEQLQVDEEETETEVFDWIRTHVRT